MGKIQLPPPLPCSDLKPRLEMSTLFWLNTAEEPSMLLGCAALAVGLAESLRLITGVAQNEMFKLLVAVSVSWESEGCFYTPGPGPQRCEMAPSQIPPTPQP